MLQAAILILLNAAAATGNEPLACPPGTELRSEPGDEPGMRNEVCRDTKTNLREGPSREWHANGKVAVEGGGYINNKHHGKGRLYSDSGDFLGEVEYDKGEMKGSRLTVAGLNYALRQFDQHMEGKEVTIQALAIDEATVRVDFTLPPGKAPPVGLESAACGIFELSTEGLTTLLVRISDRDAKVLRETKLARSDCPR